MNTVGENCFHLSEFTKSALSNPSRNNTFEQNQHFISVDDSNSTANYLGNFGIKVGEQSRESTSSSLQSM